MIKAGRWARIVANLTITKIASAAEVSVEEPAGVRMSRMMESIDPIIARFIGSNRLTKLCWVWGQAFQAFPPRGARRRVQRARRAPCAVRVCGCAGAVGMMHMTLIHDHRAMRGPQTIIVPQT